MNETLKTTDIYLTAYLIANSKHPKRAIVEGRERRKKVIFQFERDAMLVSLEQGFRDGTATIRVGLYKESLERVKDLMFARLREC